MKIAHLNTHNEMMGVNLIIDKHKPVSFGLNESNRLGTELNKLKPYRKTVIQGATDRRSKETPILTLMDREITLQLAFRGAVGAEPEKFAPPRYVTVVGWEEPGIGMVAHINVHFHALIRDRAINDSLRVRQMAELVLYLKELIHFLERTGYNIILSGDVNMPKDNKAAGWVDIYNLLRDSMKWDCRSVGVDLMAVSRKLKFRNFIIVPKDKVSKEGIHAGLVGNIIKR